MWKSISNKCERRKRSWDNIGTNTSESHVKQTNWIPLHSIHGITTTAHYITCSIFIACMIEWKSMCPEFMRVQRANRVSNHKCWVWKQSNWMVLVISTCCYIRNYRHYFASFAWKNISLIRLRTKVQNSKTKSSKEYEIEPILHHAISCDKIFSVYISHIHAIFPVHHNNTHARTRPDEIYASFWLITVDCHKFKFEPSIR